MREQLCYWEEECEFARAAGDADRIQQCERFITQCKQVIAALEQAASPPTPSNGDGENFFFERQDP
jgi:hypothetical protein